MSRDAPKIAHDKPTQQLPEQGSRSPSFALSVAAFGGSIALVWGFETNACDGVIAGALAAMMRASFLALTHLPELAFLVMLFAAHLGIAYLAAHRPPFRGREELLAMVLPMAGFLIGLWVADARWFESTCALHPWA